MPKPSTAANSGQRHPDHMVKFGTTDLYVSRVCQGTAFRNMAESADNEMRVSVLRRCLDVGLNFFDSSNGYGMGRSERVIGEAIAGRREQAVVCTKLVRHEVPEGARPEDTFEPAQYTRDMVFENTDRSLERLGTDYLDIILLHHKDGFNERLASSDPEHAEKLLRRYGSAEPTPPEEIVDTMDALVQTGRARYWGVSSRNVDEVARLLEVCEANGKAPLACLQNGYNLIGKYADTEGLFPLLRRTGLGVQAIGPHAAGILVRPARTGGVNPASVELSPAHIELLNVVDDVAADLGVPRSQVCVAWVLSHPEITTSLAGAESPEQVEDNLAGSLLELPPEAIATLNAASHVFDKAQTAAREKAGA